MPDPPKPGPRKDAPQDPSRFDRQVHFSRVVSPVSTAAQRVPEGGVFWQMLNQYVWVFIMAVVYVVTETTNRLAGGPLWVPFIAVGACGAVAIALVGRLAYCNAKARARAASSHHAVPDENYRVRCVGREAPRARLDALGRVQDRPFEPRVFSLLTAPVLITRARRRWIGVTAFVIWVGMIGGIALFTRREPLVSLFVLASLAAPAGLLGAALWPSYLRVAPGRLDVLGYGLFGRGTPLVASIDLRTSRLIVDLPIDVLRIEREGKETVGITFAGLARRLEFAKSVLQAARCAAPTPPLPEDTLLG